MSFSKHLVEATINRLSVRLGEAIINGAEKIAFLSNEVPKKMRKELELFQEEVYEEADRLEKQDNSNQDEEMPSNAEGNNCKESIKRVRLKISKISESI
tara:strand:+ start:503 stop:799 length:297 start_codon:yes stop_codon:yes gene_type:complete